MVEYWLGLTPWKKLKLVLALVVLLFVIVFAVVNWNEEKINFIFFEIRIPITLLIVLCLGIGYALSTVFEFRKYREKDEEIRQLKARLHETDPSGPTSSRPTSES